MGGVCLGGEDVWLWGNKVRCSGVDRHPAVWLTVERSRGRIAPQVAANLQSTRTGWWFGLGVQWDGAERGVGFGIGPRVRMSGLTFSDGGCLLCGQSGLILLRLSLTQKPLATAACVSPRCSYLRRSGLLPYQKGHPDKPSGRRVILGEWMSSSYRRNH